MKIKRMTATFGALEGATLELEEVNFKHFSFNDLTL